MQRLNDRLIPFVTDYRLFDFLRENHKKPYSRIQALCDILTKAATNYKSPSRGRKRTHNIILVVASRSQTLHIAGDGIDRRYGTS